MNTFPEEKNGARKKMRLNDKESCPCLKCKIRIGYAKTFDIHFWGDDCPRVCDEFKEWNRQEI